MVKAVIFDCFGVIYIDVNQAAFKYLGIANNPHRERRYREIMDARCLGYLDKTESRKQMAELAAVPLETWNQTVEKLKGRDPEVLSYIKQVRRAGYKTALLSNAGKHQLAELFTSGEQKALFDVALVSGDVGIMKPDPAIYELVAERLGVLPKECAFIDDNIDYCRGAAALTMQAVHYTGLKEAQQRLKKLGVKT